MAEPYPKSRQIARGERRTARRRATRQEWASIIAAKRGPCRICGRTWVRMNYHHLIPRSLGGHDTEPNIVPLCGSGTEGCHGSVEARAPIALRILASKLTDDEHAHVVGEMGEGAMARLFGV